MTNIGINLAGISYWGTEEPFIDRFHTAGAWSAKNAAGTNVTSTLVYDSEGDPTNLTGVSSLSISVGVDPKSASPIDQYVITYDGAATVKVANGSVVSQTAGKVVFNYTGGDAQPFVYLTFSNLNASNPLSDVHVVRADQADLFNAGELFNPDFVAKVSQWDVVRFMDWGSTNNLSTVSWATRTTLDDGSWGQASVEGVPLEAMVKLANEAHVDMWYNVPTTADDSYVTNALTYIRDHLDPTLKVHVEWSNEVWNTGFAANGYAQTKANTLWGNGATVAHGANVYYGYRSAQIADIANHVFTGTHAEQLVEVLGGQAAGSVLMTYMLQGIAKAGLGSAATLFDEYAIAPYFGGEMGTNVSSADLTKILGWAKAGASGLDAAFNELQYGGTLTGNLSLAVVQTWLTKSAAAAQANGLDLVAYEAGTSFSTLRWAAADKPTMQDFFNRLLEDPRMGDLYTKLINDFKAAGGTEFLAFNDAGTGGDSGSWGALASIYDNGSPRYDALIAAVEPSVDTISGSSGMAAEVPVADAAVPAVATTGSDYLVATTANDTIDGGAGNDTIVGSSGSADAKGNLTESDLYMGGAGSDTIVGGIGNDHIYGNAVTAAQGSVDGADSLSGGGGNDYIQGNAGADTIDGGDGNDKLYGGGDNDSMLGGAGNDYLQGNKGSDILSGGDGNDQIHGGADNDSLSGNAGNDILYGDAGNDTLVGGAGYDTLSGGSGNDVFVFNGHDAAFSSGGATDDITDFADGLDKILLDFHVAQVLQSSAKSFSAAATVADELLHAHVGESDVAAVTVGNDTYVFWDSTGHGGALDSAVKIDHALATSFTTADFV